MFYNATTARLYLTNYRAFEFGARPMAIADPFRGDNRPTGNLYVYVGGNPTNFIDRRGLAGGTSYVSAGLYQTWSRFSIEQALEALSAPQATSDLCYKTKMTWRNWVVEYHHTSAQHRPTLAAVRPTRYKQQALVNGFTICFYLLCVLGPDVEKPEKIEPTPPPPIVAPMGPPGPKKK